MRYIEVTQDLIDFINSDEWRGEDFTAYEFNRNQSFRGKTDFGQVFTPDHICGLLAKLLKINKDDRVLDASCGSGALLMKSLYFMIKDAKETLTGDILEEKLEEIKTKQIFGIEIDSQVANLARDNLEAIKGGKSNIITEDASSEKAAQFIREHNITKAILNPPYENKYGCLKIVENVLDNVPAHTACGFILPDKKLEKASKGQMKRILSHHRLKKVIKLPEDLFFGVGVTTSIFIFEAGIPQDDRKFFACYMKEDGLVTVKNKGRHDVHNKWPEIEKHWIDIILKQSGDETCQWNKPIIKECLSYQEPQKPFEICEEDFRKTALDFLLFQEGIDAKEFENQLLKAVLYSSDVEETEDSIKICLRKNKEVQNEKNMSELR